MISPESLAACLIFFVFGTWTVWTFYTIIRAIMNQASLWGLFRQVKAGNYSHRIIAVGCPWRFGVDCCYDPMTNVTELPDECRLQGCPAMESYRAFGRVRLPESFPEGL